MVYTFMHVLTSHTHSIFFKVFLALEILFASTIKTALVSSHLSILQVISLIVSVLVYFFVLVLFSVLSSYLHF